jgi:hypothetical protein
MPGHDERGTSMHMQNIFKMVRDAVVLGAASYQGCLMSKERVTPNPNVSWLGEPR